MAQPVPSTCPFLGQGSDPNVRQELPGDMHRCFAQTPPGTIHLEHQRAYCLAAAHMDCQIYRKTPAALEEAEEPFRRVPRPQPIVLFSIVAALALGFFLLFFNRHVVGPALRSVLGEPPAPTRALFVTPTRQGTPRSGLPTLDLGGPGEIVTGTTAFATPTPEPGGLVVSRSPGVGEAGWWATGDPRGNHVNDSVLYAGFADGKVYVSLISFDLQDLPRGAPVREAYLRLTGLKSDRMNVWAGGSWSIQFLEPESLDDLAHSSFDQVLNANSAFTIQPSVGPGGLRERAARSWILDDAGTAWLTRQVAQGTTSVIARIVGPVGGNSTLFGWDSGYGGASAGEGPQLVMSFGPPPAAPPPLPTAPVIVTTPTPANVLTAAVYALRNTAIMATGTPTPTPHGAVTATPVPRYVATALAAGYQGDIAPIVIYTPVPANSATAEANAAYATAVAVTTGTFTPVPYNAVTPVVVLPTPMPQNAVTAAAQAVAATRQAETLGTATPLPYNAVIATVTPAPFVATYTPAPENQATAVWLSLNATAVAMTTGTFTPLPPLMTPTPTPLATPLPLVIATGWPTATPRPEAGAVPAEFRGKILFRTDAQANPVWIGVFDPATGQLSRLSQDWPYAAALPAESASPDGKRSVAVIDDANGFPQVVVQNGDGTSPNALTRGKGQNYDAVWSPKANRIAFVSADSGNDEIYTMNADGTDRKRLTSNTWEWDKHPSWSPDGTQIVFWSNRENGIRALWMMNADGSNQHRLLNSGYNEWDPIWVK